MIKTFITHDENGRITKLVRGEDSIIEGDMMEVPDDVTPKTHMIVDGQPVLIPPQPSDFHAFNYQAREWVFSHDLASWRQRSMRDKLLSDSDWTQNADVNLPNKQAWIDYRQALRDVTKQTNWPQSVVWPKPPR